MSGVLVECDASSRTRLDAMNVREVLNPSARIAHTFPAISTASLLILEMGPQINDEKCVRL